MSFPNGPRTKVCPQDFVTCLRRRQMDFVGRNVERSVPASMEWNLRSFTNVGPPEMQDDIRGLFPDETGGLWISTNTGLFQYQQGRFTQLSLAGKDARG